MPLHRIYHPTTVFQSVEEREALSNAITDVYARLPKFYVVVVFIPCEPSYFYTGGKAQTNWVRITVEHIAVQLPEDKSLFDPFVAKYEAAIKPFIGDKGIEHELSFSSVPMEPWRINGIRPPPLGSAAFQRWVEENKASEYEEAEAKVLS